MKDDTIIILVVAGFALLFFAFSKGLISSGGVPIGSTGIVAPQPASNYSGYLAASTAPGVSSALNSALSGVGVGLNNLFSGWFTNSPAPTPVQQGSNPASPSLAAQPSGPSAAGGSVVAGSLVGPQVDPTISYDATALGAYDWAGLSADNSYDPSYSLETTS